jgi:hypothetical protein
MFFAAPDDEVLEPAVDPAVALLVHAREVAGAQPAVLVDGGGRLPGIVELAGHHVVAAGAELAGLPVGGQVLRARLDDLDRGARQRRDVPVVARLEGSSRGPAESRAARIEPTGKC